MDRMREQELRQRHAELVEQHREGLIPAAASLIEADGWNLHAPCALIQAAPDLAGVEVLPVGRLGERLEHLPIALDGFIRLRRQGMGLEAALAQCRQEDGEAFEAAWQASQHTNALITHDNLVEFAALSQKGFGREPRELLVVVRWPDQVTAFLCACSRSGPFPL
ncbi:MAG: hypothetical protein VKN17_00210 [Cyanobacteriota bacterium]|jgi:hypothetical protein|nr:hypothetical protein [Cyanobacteriota bacterium]